ncbi:MAG: YafY family protein [Dokdonella sp.]|uniref:helix-turn-helix transcriptional regulator n=1 Tax=Dokdonella sp. TaxID=2291710 RepID=UPI0032665E78
MALPTTRVLAVLDLLQSHGRISGAELATRIGVDVRTLRRYIAMLEELGIPITTERGRYGAYLLVAGFKLPPMMFTNDEAVALSVGMIAARELGLADSAPAVASAQAKLERVMPSALKDSVRAISETVKVDLRHAPNTPHSNSAFIALTTAAQSQRRVAMRYVGSRGESTLRDFDSYGLAYRFGAWYVVGLCHLRHDLRSFRLDRVEEVSASDLRFTRPAGFDPLDYLSQSLAALARSIPVEILLRTDLSNATRAFPFAFGSFDSVEDGVILRSSADDLGWFARRLAGLPFDFEIRTPASLREELARCASHLGRLAAIVPRTDGPDNGSH